MQHDRFILRKQHQRKKSSGEVSDAYRKIQRVKAKNTQMIYTVHLSRGWR